MVDIRVCEAGKARQLTPHNLNHLLPTTGLLHASCDCWHLVNNDHGMPGFCRPHPLLQLGHQAFLFDAAPLEVVSKLLKQQQLVRGEAHLQGGTGKAEGQEGFGHMHVIKGQGKRFRGRDDFGGTTASAMSAKYFVCLMYPSRPIRLTTYRPWYLALNFNSSLSLRRSSSRSDT